MLIAKRSSLVLIAAMLVTGCQSETGKAIFDPLNLQVEMVPRDEKRVQVTPSESSFVVHFPTEQSVLADGERRAVMGFLRKRVADDTTEVYVDVSPENAFDALSLSRRQTLLDLIKSAKIDPGRVGFRANADIFDKSQIKLTVRRYLVTLPGCPDFTSRAGRTFDNRPHSNWGCATAVNFGLMIAEPRDVLSGRGGTPGDAEGLSLSVQRYRAGETKALQLDGTSTAESYGAQGESGSGGAQ